ncbi:hypothetical protein M513_04770 [Trichuris suis]|uniref:Uncharacterized protein n=1 Tax=Trichuris suis TaxID=68888 RepID=A0A085MB31_9BILA|nr:hypothetical protein M513_04770 [Trichuris suis]
MEPFGVQSSSLPSSSIYSQHDRVSPITGSGMPDVAVTDPDRSLVVDRTTKPTSSSVSVLRPLLVPTSLVQQFLEVSSVNTSRNIETCGILSGKLVCICKFSFALAIQILFSSGARQMLDQQTKKKHE